MLSPFSYKLPIAVSILLHGLVISLLFVHWPQKPTIQEPTPQHVMAEIITVESAAEKERKRKVEQQKRQQQAAQRRAEQQRKQAEQQRKQAEQKKRAAAAKAAADKKRKEDALKLQAEAKKKAEQQAEQQRLAEQQAEQQRKLQQQAAEQELQERMLQEQLIAEQKEQEEARKQAERASAIEADFMDQIRSHVSSYWRYPSVVRPEQETTVKITLVPTGQVIQVVVVKSSGNAALDRSVEQAIHRASPLPVPKEIAVFEKSFRNFTIKFRPENASW